MATIEWRAGKRGRYAYLQWSDNEGQHRESLGAISDEAAETRRIVKEAELRTGKRIISTAPLVGVVAVMYLEWHERRFPESHYRVSQIVNDHILPAFRYVAADQLAIRQAEKWGADRAGIVASSTAAKEVRTLKAMLNWAIRNEIIDYAPATKATPPQDVVSRPMHWYSMEELQALYACATDWKAVWQLMVNTGLRRSEARLLRWENVKDDAIVLVSEEDARTKGKKWREIPLTGNAQAALKVLENDGDYVLPIVTGNAITMTFRRDATKARVGGSVHSLRHTFGTHQALKGTPVRTLQQLMGHASITTTEKYMHVAEQHLKHAIAGFEL